jgi:hypothetical protein
VVDQMPGLTVWFEDGRLKKVVWVLIATDGFLLVRSDGLLCVRDFLLRGKISKRGPRSCFATNRSLAYKFASWIKDVVRTGLGFGFGWVPRSWARSEKVYLRPGVPPGEDGRRKGMYGREGGSRLDVGPHTGPQSIDTVAAVSLGAGEWEGQCTISGHGGYCYCLEVVRRGVRN